MRCTVVSFTFFQEFLLKRTAGLSAIARAGPGKVLADPDARGYALAVLDELNFSTPVAFKHKEKGAAAAAMSLLAPSALQVWGCTDGTVVVVIVVVMYSRNEMKIKNKCCAHLNAAATRSLCFRLSEVLLLNH